MLVPMLFNRESVSLLFNKLNFDILHEVKISFDTTGFPLTICAPYLLLCKDQNGHSKHKKLFSTDIFVYNEKYKIHGDERRP